ncbi:MAG: hypothetical protein QXP74_04395 [Nitrososphaerota archaeon]
MGGFKLIVMISILLLSILLMPPSIQCQPTWSLKIVFYPAKLYMGEWGQIYVNITNMDCSSRSNYLIELKSTNEKVIDEMVERSEEMKKTGMIEDYSLEAEKMWGYGGEVYGDYKLTILGACNGRSVELVSAGVWFPFKEIARAMTFWNNTKKSLEAFNPLIYIMNGSHRESSIVLIFKVFIPEDIPSEEVSMKPSIDVRLRFPGWVEYTLENYPAAENNVEIQPYRTFNLTVTDFDGLNPIPNAKIVIRRLIYYYEEREYITPENGTIKIYRLYDDKYEIAVYWNSSYKQEYPLIYFEQHWAYELSRSKNIRTRLFNLKIKPVDIHGKPLNKASIILDGIVKTSENGEATYQIVPQGNHSIQVFWRNVKVYDGWVWAGYHPTIYPWMTRPAIEHNITTSVGDLVVQVVDTGGNRIGANFTVIGLNPETSIKNFYSRNGLLNFSQVPLGEYVVRAVNVSRIFGNIVEGSITVIPGAGKISYLNLPIHSVKFHVLGMNDKPLKNAEIVFGSISTRLDDNGDVLFTGVPRGIYKFTVFWRGLKIYEKDVNIDGTLSEVVRVPVYDIHIVFLDHLGRRFYCNYSLKAPGGLSISSDKPKHEVYVEMVPEGTVNIVLYSPEGRLLLNESRLVSELAKISELKLPVSDMIVRIYFGNESLEKAEVRVKDVVYGGEYVEFTDRDGCAVFENMVFSNYSIRVNYPQTQMALKIFYHYFNGSIIDVNVEKAGLIVRVTYEDDTPIVGIEVTLFYGLTYLDRVVTDLNGYAYFKDIPKLPSYRVVVNHGGKEYSQTAIPNSTVMVKIEKPLLSRETIGMLIQISIISGISIAVAILIYKLVRYIGTVLETVPPRTPSRIHFS